MCGVMLCFILHTNGITGSIVSAFHVVMLSAVFPEVIIPSFLGCSNQLCSWNPSSCCVGPHSVTVTRA